MVGGDVVRVEMVVVAGGSEGCWRWWGSCEFDGGMTWTVVVGVEGCGNCGGDGGGCNQRRGSV